MLAAAIAKGGNIKPTHLMYKSNLSHALMKEYLNELISKSLLEEHQEKAGRYFQVTEKGRAFNREYKKMREFQKAFGL
tara:strand:+ start:1177 stop:1410 length:234 start_codon:yes stop_codon:yes gene_type:complete